MKFASAISTFGTAQDAVQNAAVNIRDELGDAPMNLAAVFATAHYEDEFDQIVTQMRDAWPDALLLGCSASGVIGDELEIESSPALSVIVGHMPGVRVQGFHVDQDVLEAQDDGAGFLRRIGARPVDDPNVILLGDPFSISVNDMLDQLAGALGGCPVVGGMASGGERPGQNALLMNEQVFREGAVGAVLSGNIRVRAVVSQGCRPIGEAFVITKADRNVILELGGRPALEKLRDMFSSLPPQDRSLAEKALFIGMVIDEYRGGSRQGDFLIRNLMGLDPNSGAIAIGDRARVGTTVQFHVRDAGSADEDLRERLLSRPNNAASPAGALLFSCNGRGTRMWERPNHDVSCLLETLGRVPTAGFFCAGELGPVGGRNFIHGHTASVALISPRD